MIPERVWDAALAEIERLRSEHPDAEQMLAELKFYMVGLRAGAAYGRAPVQGGRGNVGNLHPPGTIPWETQVAAWESYAAAGHGSQSADRIAERGGFSYREVQCAIAGHYDDTGKCIRKHPMPTGWEPRG